MSTSLAVYSGQANLIMGLTSLQGSVKVKPNGILPHARLVQQLNCRGPIGTESPNRWGNILGIRLEFSDL